MDRLSSLSGFSITTSRPESMMPPSSRGSIMSSISWANTPISPERKTSELQLSKMIYSTPNKIDMEGDYAAVIAEQINFSATKKEITDNLYEGIGFAYRILINPKCEEQTVHHVAGDVRMSWFNNRVILDSKNEQIKLWLEREGRKNNIQFNIEDITVRGVPERTTGKIKRIESRPQSILDDELTIMIIDPRDV